MQNQKSLKELKYGSSELYTLFGSVPDKARNFGHSELSPFKVAVCWIKDLLLWL
jgi:hypothetical protein